MKAVLFHEFGGLDVLQVEEVDDPQPGAGEVLIDIAASALNHLDVDIREGVSRFDVEPPFILGVEVVGRIAAVGDGVDGLAGRRPGDAVPDGHLRRMPLLHDGPRVALPHARLHQLHDLGRLRGEARLLGAAPDPRPGRALRRGRGRDADRVRAPHGTCSSRARKLQPGESVLINCVGSGIGSAALQLAKLAGAFVIGNAGSDEKLAKAQEFGLDVGVNYRDAATSPPR